MKGKKIFLYLSFTAYQNAGMLPILIFAGVIQYLV